MSVPDEEPYSTIFASLKHPIRRRILRMLSEKPMSFSEMLGVLGVSSSFLTYHLENLGELVSKIDDGRYRLSSFGEAAISTMTKVEDIPTTTSTKPKRIVNRSAVLAMGLVFIILAASLIGTFAYYTPMINDRNNTISSLNTQVSELNSNMTNLKQQIASYNATINSLNHNVTNLQKLLSTVNATFVSVGEIIANLPAWINRTVVVEGNMSYTGLLIGDWNYELSSNGAAIGVSWQLENSLFSPPESLGPVRLANSSTSYNEENVLVLGVVHASGWSGSFTSVNGTTVVSWTPIVGFIEAKSIFVI